MNRERTAAGWLYRFGPEDAEAHLVCAPPAGVGTAFFAGWQGLLPPSVAMHVVQLPGREERFGEPPLTDVRDAVGGFLPHVCALAATRPTVIFGHSLGGLLGYALAERMQEAGAAPAHLIVSGCLASDDPVPRRRVARLGQDAFVAEVAALGALPADLLAEPEILGLFLPTLRADLLMAESYYPAPALRVPLSAYGGDADPWVPWSGICAWRTYTTAGFAATLFPGSHFFPSTRRGEVVSAVRRVVEACRVNEGLS